MRHHSSRKDRRPQLLSALGALVLIVAAARPAVAQSSSTGPNGGALHVTAGLDVPSVYVFRGLVQESDPKITLWPYGDLAIALKSGGNGAVKAAAVNIGIWNSLQTGSSGSDGPSKHAHYEEDFYATATAIVGGGLALTGGYMALTSPNFMFDTVKEFQMKVTKTGKLNPYGFLAAELTDVQADAGEGKGVYLELGVGPSFALGGSKATLTIPAKLGLSVKDYYELGGEDKKFGFFDIGGLITIPLSGAPSRFGSWNLHGGVDVLALGDTTKAFNKDKASKVVGLVGIGVTY